MASSACKRKLMDFSGSSSPSPKRQKKVLTLEDKLNLIADADKNPSFTQKQLCDKYNIGRTTVSDILKRKDFYRDHYCVNSDMKKKRFGTSSKYSEVNELLFKWFSRKRAKNIQLSGPILKEKALYFAKELSLYDFKASNGWLESWRNRYSIGGFKVCGDSGDVDVENVNDFEKTKIQDLCAGNLPFDVLNCDETGAFLQTLSDKTASKKSFECKGGNDLPLSVLMAKTRVGLQIDNDLIEESDKDVATEEIYDEEWETPINEDVKSACKQGQDDSDTDSENDDEPATDIQTSLTYTRVLSMLDDIRSFALMKDDRYLGPVEELRYLTERAIVLAKYKQSQSTQD